MPAVCLTRYDVEKQFCRFCLVFNLKKNLNVVASANRCGTTIFEYKNEQISVGPFCGKRAMRGAKKTEMAQKFPFL